jgi:hypothetical protein
MSDLSKPFPPEQYPINQSILNKGRQDKYEMVLTLPKSLLNHKDIIRSNDSVDFDSLQFSITGSPVPDIIIPAIAQPFQGQEIKISSHSRSPYENIFISFTVDNLYRNWWTIYKWLNILNDADESYYNKEGYAGSKAWEAMKEYTANFTIYGLDEYDNKVIRFDYEGCFPVSLQSPKFSDQDETEISSQFEFAFTFFKATLM